MRTVYRKSADALYASFENTFRKTRHRRENIKKLSKIDKQNFISKTDYQTVILPFWAYYRYRPKKYWFDLFCYKKPIDARYIPSDLYYGEILPYFSNMSFKRHAEDKNAYFKLFNHLNRPSTIISNQAGIFYDGKQKIITRQKALDLVLSLDNVIIKPAMDSGSGRNVELLNKENLNISDYKTTIENRFNTLSANFIVQEKVKQHATLRALNKSSVNTVRVISFLFNGQVHILSSILRIGKPKSVIDNVYAGGYQCNINNDGRLAALAYDKYRTPTDTVSGIKLSDIVVPSYHKIIDIIQTEHCNFPHFKIIGWDFAIDTSEQPIFIEYNVCPGHNQMTSGPAFGHLTEAVLDDFFINKHYTTANG